MQSAPTWWLVITRPWSDTNDPEPPELNRTDASRTCSNQASVGSKPCRCLTRAFGKLLKVHMPSSAPADEPSRREAMRGNKAFFMVRPRRWLSRGASYYGRDRRASAHLVRW